MKSVVSATTTGLTARRTKAIGEITRWTVKARSSGKMERATQVTLSTIKEMDTVTSGGPTVASTLGGGREASSMESVDTSLKKETRSKESGTTAARYNGSLKIRSELSLLFSSVKSDLDSNEDHADKA